MSSCVIEGVIDFSNKKPPGGGFLGLGGGGQRGVAWGMNIEVFAKLGRLYPFYSGNFSLVNSSRIRKLIHAPNKLAWCPSPGGPILVPLDDEVGRCIFFTGDYDRKITWICRKLLRTGDTAIDIGANLGVVTLAMARFVGPSGSVHAFEPNPRMQALLSQSVDKTYHNVTLHKIALGSEETELVLQVPPINFGAGSFVNYRDAEHTEGVPCKIRRLSDVAKECRIKSVGIIKIDVEGFESEVLLGAADMISNTRPRAIIFETNGSAATPFRERETTRILSKLGYRFLAIPKALIKMCISEFDVGVQGSPSHDVLAVPAENYQNTLAEI
jgi:FkbM family methyltransferase